MLFRSYAVERLEDRDWVRAVQADFQPVQVSPRMWVVPTWHTAPDAGAINLIIDPGLAFGTGSHATTRLVLQWIERAGCAGRRVLDYGCGSGILGIVAARLGAAEVDAVDVDPQALLAAAANATANQAALRCSTPDALPGGQYDLVLANILANVIRGTGNMRVPAAVLGGAAALQIPLCGALVLGIGPLPPMGISGAAIAYILCFGLAALGFAAYIAAGHTGLDVRRTWHNGAVFSKRLFAEILRVGLLSSFNAVQTIAASVIVTGFVGAMGTAALAGFGLGVRLELLQIPVVFAIGSALVVMTGTAIGAGDVARARRVAWSGAALAAAVTGSVGLIVALWPGLWVDRFSSDAAALEAAYTYLRIAGLAYAFLGVGVALYFASQGSGKMLWAVLAGSLRFLVAVIGGWLALHVCQGTLTALFAVIACAMVAYGLSMAATVKWGRWK